MTMFEDDSQISDRITTRPDEGQEELSADEIRQQKEDDVANKLTQIDSKLEANSTLAQIVADPAVRQVLDARQRGEDVEVLAGRTEPAEQVVPSNGVSERVDLEEFDNTQLAEWIVKQVTGAVGPLVESKTKPLEQRLKASESFVQAQEQSTIVRQVEAAKGKFEDFEDMRPVMLKINGQSPGLSIEELYYLAKLRVGGPKQFDQRSSSEKPTHGTARPESRKIRQTPLPRGRQGFAQMVEEALDKRDF